MTNPSDNGADLQFAQAFEVKVPKLSSGALQSLAFEHFDHQRKSESQPTAEEIVGGFKSNGASSTKEVASKARQQTDWIAARCVEYLRCRIAEMNNPLVLLAAKTKSPEVRERVVYRIYNTIASAYPDLAKAASEARIHKTRQIAEIHQDPAPAVAAEPPPEAKKDGASDAEGDLNQIGNAQLAALRLVHQYVVPAAAAEGITIDAQQASGLVMNALIQSFFQRSHNKLARTRKELK